MIQKKPQKSQNSKLPINTAAVLQCYKIRFYVGLSTFCAFFTFLMTFNSAIAMGIKSENLIQNKPETENNFQKITPKSAQNNTRKNGISCSMSDSGVKLGELINQKRSKSQQCGTQKIDSAPRLSLDCGLSAVAESHAKDMDSRTVLSHFSADGADLQSRAERAGVAWTALAENVAAGYEQPDRLLESWMQSEAHCLNLMNEIYDHIGIGQSGGYWSVVFSREIVPIQAETANSN